MESQSLRLLVLKELSRPAGLGTIQRPALLNHFSVTGTFDTLIQSERLVSRERLFYTEL